MRSTFKVIAAGALLLIPAVLLSLREADTKAQTIRERLLKQADSLSTCIRQFQGIPKDATHTRHLQQSFRQIRLAYKKMEWAVEYFDPLTTRLVNGPPVPEAELNGQVIQPDGLQVIEQDIFPRFAVSKRRELTGLVSRLSTNAIEFHEYFQKADLKDWQIMDAAKQEVFRVEVLGLNDFDDPLLKNCFAESAVVIKSVQEVVSEYDQKIEFDGAIRYLQHPINFDYFDRSTFITRYANPLTRSITQLQRRLNLLNVRYNRLLNEDAGTLFDKNAFNRNAFTDAPGDSA